MDKNIIVNSRDRGKLNVNINEVLYNNLIPDGYPNDPPSIPPVTNEVLGEWVFENFGWSTNDSEVLPGEIFTSAHDPHWAITKFILNSTDRNSTDLKSIMDQHNNSATAIDVEFWYRSWSNTNFKFRKTVQNVYFRQVPGKTDVYYTVFSNPPNLNGVINWGIIYDNSIIKMIYSYNKDSSPTDKKTYKYENNFQSYTAIGEEVYGDLVSDILVQGKDTYLRLSYSVATQNMNYGEPYAMGIVLGHAGSDAHEIYYGPTQEKSPELGDTAGFAEFVLPVKLDDYDWFQFTIKGIAIPDSNFTVDFIYEDIQ